MNISCSQCGAQIELGPTHRFIECRYCSSPLLVLGNKTYQPLLVLPLLEKKKAVQRIEEKTEFLVSRQTATELIFIPYWIDGSQLILSTPSLGILECVPLKRPKPAGQLQYKEDMLEENKVNTTFLDPETVSGADTTKREIFYIPFYRCTVEGAEQEEGRTILVDGLDGTVLTSEDEATLSPVVKQDLIWCGAVLLLPVITAVFGGHWLLVVGSGLIVAGLYHVFRGE